MVSKSMKKKKILTPNDRIIFKKLEPKIYLLFEIIENKISSEPNMIISQKKDFYTHKLLTFYFCFVYVTCDLDTPEKKLFYVKKLEVP